MLLFRLWSRFAAPTLTSVIVLAIAVYAQAPTQPDSLRVTILQLNDVYQTMPTDGGKSGGLARIATLREKIAAESPNTLFLLAGDTISPSVASTVFKGEQMIAVWNAIGLDYAVLGNHEFDFGPDTLLARMKESKFVWLGSNVIDRRTNKPFGGTPPYVIRNFNGVKIGLIGLLTPDTATDSKPGANVRFVNPVLAARNIVRQLRQKGAQVIIAITHLAMSEDKELARRVPQIDVIVGGHEHQLLQSHAGRAPIFKWGADARTLGRIDLNISTITRKVVSIDWAGIPVTPAIADNPAAASVIAVYEKKLGDALGQTIGQTSVELDARSITNRRRETNLGNLVADAFRKAVDADVALLNGGSIRANTAFRPGPITKRDAVAILPFGNPIVKIEVKGATLRAALENGVSRIIEEEESGRFPQISGLSFTFDGRKSAGSRVVEVRINGQPLDEKKNYSLAIAAYLFDGGDGYSMFTGSRLLVNAESAQIDSAILADAITSAGTVSPQIERRSKRLDVTVVEK
ncbi:MAG TPA: 5'-nucleotidase C-terminal domain-containing protein [Blastocatellia bacterium]|nr:5'-nucleotidase C-terminal domain-containing protein [Blastocatellia bacterium]